MQRSRSLPASFPPAADRAVAVSPLRAPTRIALQVAALMLAFALLSWILHRLGSHLSTALLGFVLLWVGLTTRLIPARAVDEGARWLLAKGAIFLIPPVVAIARERQILSAHWLPFVVIIVGGTVVTTLITALAVEMTCRKMAPSKP